MVECQTIEAGYAGYVVVLPRQCPYRFLYDSSSDAAYKIEYKKTFRTPYVFEHATEHPEGEHVEEYMNRR